MTNDLDDYWAVVGELLLRRPIENTVALTVLASLRDGVGPTGVTPIFGWWCPRAGVVEGAFFHTPPYPVLAVEVSDEALEPLVDLLAEPSWSTREINVEGTLAGRFAGVWLRRTGVAVRRGVGLRLFRLGELRPPVRLPEGQARRAATADRELLLTWCAEFAHEVGEPPGHAAAWVDERLAHGVFTLWEEAGRPVSMAGTTRPVAGVVRVGPVYTPPAYRRRGYASAVTAVASRAALDAGANAVVLYTDLANLTSNAIYQRLGYQPVSDRAVLVLTGS